MPNEEAGKLWGLITMRDVFGNERESYYGCLTGVNYRVSGDLTLVGVLVLSQLDVARDDTWFIRASDIHCVQLSTERETREMAIEELGEG